MNKKFYKLNYITVAKYLLIFLSFLIFSSLSPTENVISVAVFVSSLFSSANVFIILFEHILTVFILGNTALILPIIIADCILIIVFCFYHRAKTKIKAEIIAYTLLSLIPYIFLPASNTQENYIKNIISILFTGILSFVLYKTISVINKKGLKYKFTYEEIIFLCLTIIFFGVGTSNFTSPLVFKAISIFAMLTVAFIYRIGITSIFSSILGLSLSIYYSDINYIAIYLLLSLSIESMMPLNRFLPCPVVLVCDYMIFYFFKC